MNRVTVPIAITIVAFSALSLSAGQLVLVLQTGGESWRVQEVERLTFNQKDKVRVGALDRLDLQSDRYKRLPAVQIPQAGIMRRHAGGFLVRKSAGGAWEAVVPDGAAIKGNSSYAAVWSTAVASAQLEKTSKTATAIRTAEIVAILPGTDRNLALANFLADESNFRGVGEKDADAAFTERMSLLAAVAPSLPEPAAGKVKQVLLTEMDSASQRLSGGLAHYSDLQRGLKFVAVSERVFANDDVQKKSRKVLLDRQAWLNTRIAILKALAAGDMWDALIDKYTDLERWDNSFEDMRTLRQLSFRKSAAEHQAAGERLRAAKQFSVAVQEFKLAALRNPGDKTIAALLDEAKSEAEADPHRGKLRKQEDAASPEYRRVTRYLADADNLATTGQFDEAEQQLSMAEKLAPDSPRVILARAKLFDARKEPLKALDRLDEYMRSVSGEKEINDGESLRSRIRLTLTADKRRLKDELSKAETDGDFVKAFKAAQAGLALDPADLDFLLHGATENAILRKYAEATQLLNQYLEVSSASTNSQRTEAYNMLPRIKAGPPEPNGTPNWFSGYKSPAGLFYCPISLAPNPRVAEVKASKKQTTTFQWAGERLASVHVSTQQQGEKDFFAYFDYFKDRPAVRRVGVEQFDAKEDPPTPRFTAAGAVGTGKGAFVALANHPVIDPVMVARLTGKSVAVLVTGNPYFHPFVWQGVYAFLADYDDQGRVAAAHEIPKEGQPAHVFDFKWDGLKLMEIAERGGAYRRSMSYSGGKLTLETISFGGKNFKIEYKYTGDRLTAVRCDDDPSLDGRSRNVTFR